MLYCTRCRPWGPSAGVKYTGLDIVPAMVAANKRALRGAAAKCAEADRSRERVPGEAGEGGGEVTGRLGVRGWGRMGGTSPQEEGGKRPVGQASGDVRWFSAGLGGGGEDSTGVGDGVEESAGVAAAVACERLPLRAGAGRGSGVGVRGWVSG